MAAVNKTFTKLYSTPYFKKGEKLDLFLLNNIANRMVFGNNINNKIKTVK